MSDLAEGISPITFFQASFGNNFVEIASLCFSCALYGALYSGYQVQIRIKLQTQYILMSFNIEHPKLIILELKCVILFSIMT